MSVQQRVADHTEHRPFITQPSPRHLDSLTSALLPARAARPERYTVLESLAADHTPSRSTSRGTVRWLALILSAGMLLGGTVAVTADPRSAVAAENTGGLGLGGENSSLLSADTTAIAPGLDLTSFQRLQPQGWVTGHILVADLETPTLSMDVLDHGAVSGGATVSDQVGGTGAIAAVNGDYFDMNASGAPVSTNVSSTRGVLNATNSNRPAFTMADGIAAIQQIASAATVTINGDTLDVPSVNAPTVPAGSLGYYTPLWGSHPLSRVLGGPANMTKTFAVATLTDGVVTSVTSDPAAVKAETTIASGSAVLVGREASAARIAALTVGQTADVTVSTSADVDLAVSGSQRLLIDGVQTAEDQVEAARTAVGVNQDGTIVYVASIEGHAADARGMTVQEVGRLMLDLGAYNAVNLDGGGSSTLVARLPGTDASTLVNRPSDGTEYPLRFERIRMMETRSTASYHGEVSIAGISSVVAPDVAQPAASIVYDDVIVTDGTVAGRAQRIAVMSDAQFVARTPDGAIVQAARRTLQEIVAEKPDLLVINGDLVDEASVADFDLARSVLDEEVGDAIPWIYVPGNHEVMGGAISNFEAEFGETSQVKQLGGTLVVTLNTANGSLARSDSAQLGLLEDALATAAADSGITGVVVFAHHPTNDPLPSKASQLSDRFEAEALEASLAAFRADSGKSIATVNAHVGVFHATSFDGVSSIINGNSGKGPSGTPETGGFTGWTMLGLNPAAGVVGSTPTTVADRIAWLQAETKPRVDEIRLDVPTTMIVGETATIDASIVQDGDRVVPVQWPMSAGWSGKRVVIDAGTVKEHAASALRFNPTTKKLTAVTPGDATLQLTVNGKTVSVTVKALPVRGGPGSSTR
ncbi:hypothetical protein E3O53_14670 [Cryobacterium sp. TMT2-18-3]|uniref:phosphodiester glycosidase family protein n=1 Tax=unclassified Cryobacterium TaxID=2649013 RepID=UPI00106C21E4|nr:MULTISPECIES: phosphodiester glycosidase family protein [unclassified Cryobacterium]TFC24333.1 hypothetical protein E3O22_15420 [Cryobacterium sp. TMT2-18-2]TFC61261.1 hypothetical protein E3O53_14670 [Cryobacterium sp. TMT2-18-3]